MNGFGGDGPREHSPWERFVDMLMEVAAGLVVVALVFLIVVVAMFNFWLGFGLTLALGAGVLAWVAR